MITAPWIRITFAIVNPSPSFLPFLLFSFQFHNPKVKGLPPLPDPWASKSAATTRSGDAMDIKPNNKDANSKEKTSLSFSSGSSLPSRSVAAKRKAAAVGDGRGEDDDEGADEDLASRVRVAGATSSKAKPKKKPKVGLSFADDT